MKKSFYLLFIAVLLGCSTSQPEVHITQPTPGTYQITSGNYSLQIDANVGARITSAKIGDNEILVSKEDEKIAFGSTFWPSPYLKKWPPPVDYDQSPWQVQELKNGLSLTGPVIESLNLQFQKQVTFHPETETFDFEFTIINHNDTAFSVAPWEVTRLPKGGEFMVPANETEHNLNQKLNGVEYLFESGFYQCFVPELYAGKSQKIGIDVAEGWQVYVLEKVIFLKIFENIEAIDFAPKSADAEFYIDDDSPYVEVESQGKYTKIQPNASVNYKTRWKLIERKEGEILNLGELRKMATELDNVR